MADPDASLAEKLEAISTSSVVIGVRLHALVLAAAVGVPAIAISYDPKVDAFAERAGIPVIGSTSAAIDPGLLIGAVEQSLRLGGAVYGDRVTQMRAEADAAVRNALEAMGRPS